MGASILKTVAGAAVAKNFRSRSAERERAIMRAPAAMIQSGFKVLRAALNGARVSRKKSAATA
jgi:hypothetical protein